MWRNLWELCKIVIISAIIILPIRFFIIQPFYVKGASMEPNFQDHEYLIVDEISYRFQAPQRGDIIVFRYPEDPQEYFIKRIIGLPGEKVQVKDGHVYVYNQAHPTGQMLDESQYLSPLVDTNSNKTEPVELKAKEYFVMGDNRTASMDSRVFGPVNESFFTGRVWLRISFNLKKTTAFKTPVYQF